MRLGIDIFHHLCGEDPVSKKLDIVIQLLKDIQRRGAQMSQALDDLEVSINENTSLDASIIQLVNGLALQIESLKDDPAKLAELATSLRASSTAISEAIQANTPTG